MNILKNYSVELKKHKHRHNLLIFVAVVLAEMFFICGNYHSRKGISDGWMILFYIIPIINCLFFPIAIAGFSSRLMDIEHKGDMLKCLYTFSTPKKLFYTKFLYGALSIFALVIMQCGSIVLTCKILDFGGTIPVKYMLIHGVNTFVSCMVLFSLHLLLSFKFRNQAVSISVGIFGSFLGFFSSVLPTSILQKILPWGSFFSSSFVGMDWDRESGEVAWLLTEPDFAPLVFGLGWIVLLSIITLIILGKSGVEDSERNAYSRHTSEIRIHKRPIEILKLKRSPAWIAFFIVPAVSAIIGTINYLGNISILKDGWYSLWTQHTLFLCYFFMPIIIGLFAGCIWRVDHNGTNMNLLMTHQKAERVVLGKYAATCFISAISIVWVAILYLISGFVIHIDGQLPSGLIRWLGFGILGACVICAFQVFVSLVIRNFILPIIIAFLGGIAGIGCIAKGIPYFTPFSLFDIAMNQRDLGSLNMGSFLLSSLILIAVFIMISILYLKKSDVRSHE